MIGHEFENLNNNNNKLLYGDSDDKIKPSYYGHDDSLSPPSKFERSDDEVSEDEEEDRGNKDPKKSRFVGNFFIFHLDETNNNVQSICIQRRGCRGRDRMVVGFLTTYAISAYHH